MKFFTKPRRMKRSDESHLWCADVWKGHRLVTQFVFMQSAPSDNFKLQTCCCTTSTTRQHRAIPHASSYVPPRPDLNSWATETLICGWKDGKHILDILGQLSQAIKHIRMPFMIRGSRAISIIRVGILTSTGESRGCRCLHSLPSVVPVFGETVDDRSLCCLFLPLFSVKRRYKHAQQISGRYPGTFTRHWLKWSADNRAAWVNRL